MSYVMIDILPALFILLLMLVGFVFGGRVLFLVSVVGVMLLWLVPVWAADLSFRWEYKAVKDQPWVGEITLTNPSIYSFAMAGPNGVRKETESVTIETEQGPITILATITRNTDCVEACPDIFEIVEWPEGYAVSPAITEITEEKSQIIKIFPLIIS